MKIAKKNKIRDKVNWLVKKTGNAGIVGRFLERRSMKKIAGRLRTVDFTAGKKLKYDKMQAMLVTEISGKIPNHGDRMEYFERFIGKKLFVTGKDGKPRLGGRIATQIIGKYHKKRKSEGDIGYIFLPKELEPVPLQKAIERSLMAMVDSKAMQGIGKKLRQYEVRKAIKKLYKQGKISFEGNTNVDFTTESKENLIRALGVHGQQEFIKAFKQYLTEETGWARDYIRRKIEHVLLKPWD